MKIYRLFLILTLFVVFGCKTEEPFDSIVPSSQENIASTLRSPEDVMAYVQKFVDALDETIKSRSGSRRIVSDISPLTKEKIMSRAVISPTYDLHRFDTLAYIINFADSAGYAIAGASLESEPIYAVIDDGNLNWDDLDDPIVRLKHFQVCNFMNMALIGPTGGGVGGGTPEKDSIIGAIKNWDIVAAKSPILKSKWSQGSPYSNYCPNNTTGCVSTALAQIMCHFKRPASVPNQGNSSRPDKIVLDWNVIDHLNSVANGKLSFYSVADPNIDAIAHLCRYIGRENDAKYKSDVTSINSNKALKWVGAKCNLTNSGLKKYDEKRIYESICSGNPVYGRGNSKKTTYVWLITVYTQGHAWIYDGYIMGYDNDSKDPSNRKLMFHCNWGWGGMNDGFFLSRVFNSYVQEITEDEYEDFEDDEDPWQEDDGTPKYYRYNLEYATFD